MMISMSLKSLIALLFVLGFPRSISNEGVSEPGWGVEAWPPQSLLRPCEGISSSPVWSSMVFAKNDSFPGPLGRTFSASRNGYDEIPALRRLDAKPPWKEKKDGDDDFISRVAQQAALRPITGFELVEQYRPDNQPATRIHPGKVPSQRKGANV